MDGVGVVGYPCRLRIEGMGERSGRGVSNRSREADVNAPEGNVECT